MIDVKAVLGVADEIERAEQQAVADFAAKDGSDPIGSAYADGGVDALDHGWVEALRKACEAGDGGASGRDALAHDLDMAAFRMARYSSESSDMLSALAAALKHAELGEFEERWLA